MPFVLSAVSRKPQAESPFAAELCGLDAGRRKLTRISWLNRSQAGWPRSEPRSTSHRAQSGHGQAGP